MNTKANTTVVVPERMSDGIDYSQVRGLDDAIAAANAAGLDVQDITDFGDGFVLLDSGDKATLKGVPFVIMDGMNRVDKSTGRSYVSLRIVTGDGRKLIVNDGSVGIYEQAQSIFEKRGTLRGLIVKDGLTGGEYTTTITNSKGESEKVTASTYYFAGV